MKIFHISNHHFSTHIKIISTHAFHLGQRQKDTSIITYQYYLWQSNIFNGDGVFGLRGHVRTATLKDHRGQQKSQKLRPH